jgi:formylglycine-generating enzyme required for sulfatase activity
VPFWAAGAIAATALLAGLAAGPPVLTGLGIIERNPTDADLRAELDAARKRASEAETARKEAGAKYSAALGERDRAREALAAAQAKGEDATGRVADLTGQLGTARQQLKDAEAQLAAQLKVSGQKLSEAQAALKSANDRADREEAARKKADMDLAAAIKGRTPGKDGGTTGKAGENLKAGEPFKDCANCPEMVTVPAGNFTMGAAKGQPESADNERPQHEVAFAKPFAVGRFAVTFAEWDACANDGDCDSYLPKDEGWGRGSQPVINVSWNDAKAYVKWLSEKTGKQYRLLSEAEREYVTRAGTKGAFWWGPSISPDQANYDGNYTYNNGPTGKYRKQTMPVKSFEPNPWGLYQVHGNVWEWVEDCWHDSYHNAPSDGSAWTTEPCTYRVLRGGSWDNDPQNLRATRRYGNSPGFRNVNIGFRVALGWQDLNR